MLFASRSRSPSHCDAAALRGELTELDEFLKLADREVLAHAGSLSHAEAVQKAELEFETFTAARRALPSSVEQHFDEAVKNVKQLERGRREKLKGKRGKQR